MHQTEAKTIRNFLKQHPNEGYTAMEISAILGTIPQIVSNTFEAAHENNELPGVEVVQIKGQLYYTIKK